MYPLGLPSSSLTIRPSRSSVSFVTPAASSAFVLSIILCPQNDISATGLSGMTASKSCLVNGLTIPFSPPLNHILSQPCPLITLSFLCSLAYALSLFCICFITSSGSSVLGFGTISTKLHVPNFFEEWAICICASPSPGIMLFPLQSITSVLSPIHSPTPASSPTYANLPSLMATASAWISVPSNVTE